MEQQHAQIGSSADVLNAGLDEAAKAALILAALPKLEQHMESTTVLDASNPEVVEHAAKLNGAGKGKDRVPAGLNYTAYGTEMAKSYLEGLKVAGKTWADSIVYLLKTADDKGREAAMTSAFVYAKKQADEWAGSSLRKRIGEARRIFKAATIKGHAEVLATMTGKGTWVQKLSKIPKVSKAGAKKKVITPAVIPLTGSTPPVLPSAIPEPQGSVAKGTSHIAAVKYGEVVDMVKRLTLPQQVMLVDVIAFNLKTSTNIFEQSLGVRIMEFRDKQEEVGKADGLLRKVG